MPRKTALITGVTGQDGSYLTDFLLAKGYKIIGVKRRSSSFNTKRIDHIYNDFRQSKNFIPFYGDLTDSSNILRIIQSTKPDEIYNLERSHMCTLVLKFTANADVGNFENFRSNQNFKITKQNIIKSLEIFGNTYIPQNEKTLDLEVHAISKLYAYWTTVNYIEGYNIFIKRNFV